MCKEITWLNVTGCPRSGTTALGAALNKSRQISLLHEHYPKDFFDSIESLFKNQDFHGSLDGLATFEDSLLLRERDLSPLVKSIFEIVFKKPAAVIGSKFPGLQRWERTTYPAGVSVREINIVRNPIDVVNSYMAKADGTLPNDPEQAFCDWLNSFNHAVSQQGRSDFLWLLYEDFRLGENEALAAKVAEFLLIDADFDFAELDSPASQAVAKFHDHASGQRAFDAISTLFDISRWKEDAAQKIASGRLVGYPLPRGSSIDLAVNGTAWKYVFNGLYEPEPDGSWTKGAVATLCFTPEDALSGDLSVTLDISWALNLDGVGTMFRVYLDDTLIGKTTLTLGASAGGSNLVIYHYPNFRQLGRSITLKVVVDNPRNPAALGLSADDRELGLMIRSIAFSN